MTMQQIPQIPLAVDYLKSYAPKYAAIPQDGMLIDVVTGEPITLPTNATVEAGVLHLDGGNKMSLPSWFCPASSAYSFSFVMRFRMITPASGLDIIGTGSTASTNWTMEINSHSSRNLIMDKDNSGGDPAVLLSSAYSGSEWLTAAGSYDGSGTTRIFFAVDDLSGSSQTGTHYNTTNAAQLGDATSDTEFEFLYLWDEAIPDEALQRIKDEPLSVLRPVNLLPLMLGSASSDPVISGTGGLVAESHTLTASVNFTRVASGSLVADVAVISGSGDVGAVLTASGGLVASDAVITASVTQTVKALGALLADEAIISGGTSLIRTAIGNLLAEEGVISGAVDVNQVIIAVDPSPKSIQYIYIQFPFVSIGPASQSSDYSTASLLEKSAYGWVDRSTISEG